MIDGVVRRKLDSYQGLHSREMPTGNKLIMIMHMGIRTRPTELYRPMHMRIRTRPTELYRPMRMGIRTRPTELYRPMQYAYGDTYTRVDRKPKLLKFASQGL